MIDDKWTQGRYNKLMVRNGSKSLQEVRGYVRGKFGIRKEMWKDDQTWVVTHLDSGNAMFRTNTLALAKRLISTIEQTFDTTVLDRYTQPLSAWHPGDTKNIRQIKDLIANTKGASLDTP